MYGRVVTGLSPVSEQARKAWNGIIDESNSKSERDGIRVWGNHTYPSFVRVERTLILSLYLS